MLGSGTPIPDPRRAGPGLAIVVRDRAYLVDAGAGIVRRAAQAAEHGLAALSPARLTHLFITHLHSDHTLGLADVMLTPAVMGRPVGLRLFGPPELPAMVDHLRAAYAVDLQTRAMAEGDSAGYRSLVQVVQPGSCYKDELVQVTAFSVPHGTFTHAFGYRFEAQDRVVVVSGDTTPSEAVVQACRGCDVLVHEVYCEAGLKRLPKHVQRYHRRFHTSGPELARLATRAHPQLLLLTHLLPFDCDPTFLLGEVRAGYHGEVAVAEDLQVY